MSKTSVLIIGVTGRTGKSIADALLDQPDFRVVVAVRTSSLEKPAVAALKAKGAEVRELDLEGATHDQLVAILKDIDIAISCIDFDKLHLQYPLIDAAKQTNLKRFIPSDWSPACKRGVRALHDEKLAIHEYIEKSGIGHTFIDTGAWSHLSHDIEKRIFGTGDVKSAIIDIPDIGAFVSRILRDPRTLNCYVFCYAEEVTQNEILVLSERISGRKFEPKRVNEEEVKELRRNAKGVEFAMLDYVLSLRFRGDNTIANAKTAEYGGALDARELYPDFKPRLLEDIAKEFYGVPST
ncbi:NAD-binding protein [Fomitiporia mediterranea MF3/22]|uniref:NAD-binding protein n=1 Tax=Fomitiporia mediterranea (strain MF3/22) TaxID=694068 RepID=UPI00044076F0|nr:NAD-binding protein [Fomitiporia mediterranea MF3/22]EJC99627.1 NAD-binding protein [Fomitiporia mediterranea MF3/22]